MKGVISAIGNSRNGVFTIKIQCNSRESYEIVKKKLRLIGVFVTIEKGKGLL